MAKNAYALKMEGHFLHDFLMVFFCFASESLQNFIVVLNFSVEIVIWNCACRVFMLFIFFFSQKKQPLDVQSVVAFFNVLNDKPCSTGILLNVLRDKYG